MNSSSIDVRDVRAESVEIQEDAIALDLLDGRTMTVPIVWYPRLWYGTTVERTNFELLDEGRYINWPELDEDLIVEGMVAGRRSMESPKSLKKWLAAREDAQKHK